MRQKMKESDEFVRWRNSMLARESTTPGVAIDFAGHQYPVCITDDGRTFIQLPVVTLELAPV